MPGVADQSNSDTGAPRAGRRQLLLCTVAPAHYDAHSPGQQLHFWKLFYAK